MGRSKNNAFHTCKQTCENQVKEVGSRPNSRPQTPIKIPRPITPPPGLDLDKLPELLSSIVRPSAPPPSPLLFELPSHLQNFQAEVMASNEETEVNIIIPTPIQCMVLDEETATEIIIPTPISITPLSHADTLIAKTEEEKLSNSLNQMQV